MLLLLSFEYKKIAKKKEIEEKKRLIDVF
jgi:hypothetical protein